MFLSHFKYLGNALLKVVPFQYKNIFFWFNLKLNFFHLFRRTADVRSVGYSELFSLSREDVLAAMKDYPEAQEILQTLGRKRLMEVRCVNKRHPKIPVNPANDPHITVINKGEDSSDNSASKRIVDKLKSDVKGFKNALRKSRYVKR